MATSDRKRSLSESSEEDEAEAKKTRVESDRDSLTEVTDQSESESSSSSDTDSDSNSSSSSSEIEKDKVGLFPVIEPKGEKDSQRNSAESDLKTNSQMAQESSKVEAENLSELSEPLDDSDKGPDDDNRERQLSLSAGAGWGGTLDEIQQFLTDSVPGSAGPVDPVFVDHEDSQHATNMDSLVFDSKPDSIAEMNEPRLESVCNSALNSTEGSLVLGELEPDCLSSSTDASMKVESLKIKINKKNLEVTSHSRPVLESDDDSDSEVVKKRRKKKTKKRKKKAKDSETEIEDDKKHTKQNSKYLKSNYQSVQSSQKASGPAHQNVSAYQTSHEPSSKLSLQQNSLCGSKSKLVSQVNSYLSSNVEPSLPSPPSLHKSEGPPSRVSNPPQIQDLTELTNTNDTNSQEILKPEISQKDRAKKNKKLSIKDYKAKKEAEKLRRSLESSGSDTYSAPTSGTPSKEASPQPEAQKCSKESPTQNSDSREDSSKPLEMEPISDNDIDLAQTEDDIVALQGFDVLDEIDDIETDNDISKDSGDESDSLAEDEVDQMLEQDVPKPVNEEKEEILPQEKLRKLVLEEPGQNEFEVLPLGWVSVTHNSGIPLFLHRDTRVVTTSRPYDLGNGSVRKHNVPISAIPCYSYRYYSDKKQSEQDEPTVPPAPPPPSACPFSRENVSPDSTTDGTSAPPGPISAESAQPIDTNVFPRAQIETIEETRKITELSPEEVTKYCEKLFVFKELEVAKFKTWKERRAYYKQSHKKKLEKELTSRPTLPEGTKIITIPSLELATIPGTEGDSAINQKVVKKTKKKWIINPVGKSMVCLLHEYVQQSLKMQPYYTFTELDNSATPYAATVRINKIEYGRGIGSSKKIAKSEAARRTLEMLIPEIRDKLPALGGAELDADGPDLSFFDDIRVEDPRVADLCNRTSEPAPYQILVTCLQRNYGLGDTHINQELKAVRNGKNEYTMKVNKREVSVICKNKKDGKQLAAQKLLQQLHPHITSWGSLLRMYGNRSIRKLKIKKEKETEVTGLQTRSSQSNVAPSLAILDKLREEMRNLRDIKNSIAPIGKFVASWKIEDHVDHVDL